MVKGSKSLFLPFTRFYGAYHQKAGTNGKRSKNPLRIIRLAASGRGIFRICTQMETTDSKGTQAFQVIYVQPFFKLVCNSVGDANRSI